MSMASSKVQHQQERGRRKIMAEQTCNARVASDDVSGIYSAGRLLSIIDTDGVNEAGVLATGILMVKPNRIADPIENSANVPFSPWPVASQ